MCLNSNTSNTINITTPTHCCSSGGSRSAAAGESRRGRGGGATEDGIGGRVGATAAKPLIRQHP